MAGYMVRIQGNQATKLDKDKNPVSSWEVKPLTNNNQNSQQNTKWYAGDTPTWRESIGRAYQIAEMDRERGQKAYNDLQYLKNDPNSRYYRYYASATNGAIQNLENLGFDTRLLQQEGFFDDPETRSFINNNLERSGTTNSPKSPTKKTSVAGQQAYWLTQYQAAIEDTKNAKAEKDKITNKAKTLAGWKDRNYSDEQIMELIYGKDGEQFKKDYPTLYRMQNRANEFNPVELNEAVDFTQDLLYGATWLGRNPDADGKYTLEQAMAMSYMGKGEVWKEDPVISAKLNPESTSFAPYSVGRTGLDDAALHFGTDRFDNNWLSANQHLVFDGTDEDKKYYNQVLAGKENYDAATTAINALNLWADKYKDSTDYDTIKKDFDTMLAKGYIIIGTGKNEGKVFTKDVSNSQRVDLSILNKMDKSMGKGDLSPTESDKYGTGDLIPMMDSVDYKYSLFLDKMSGQVDYNRHKRVGYDTLAGLDLTKNPEAEREKYPFELIDETKTKKVSRVLDIVEEKLSPKEKQHFAALPNANGMKLAEAFAKAKEGVLMDGPVNTKLLTDPVWLAQMATKQVEKAENDYMATSLQSLQLRNEFEKTEKETEKIQSKIDDLNSEYGAAVLASQNVPEDMTVDIDGLPGMQVTFTQDKNGKYNLSSEFDLDSPFMNNYLASNGISKEEFKKKVNETEQRVNNYADSVREAKKQYENGRVHELEDLDSGVKLEIPYVPDGQGGYTLSPEFNSQSEEVKRYMEASGTTENELWKEINDYMNQLNDGISAYQQQMNALTARLDANSIYLKNNREAYDEAAVAVDRANQRRMRQGDLALRNSGMTIDPAMSDAVLNIVAGFTGYENPQDGYDSLVETLQQHYGMRTFTGEDLKELDGYIAELNSQAELYREIVKNYDLPENYKNSMEQCADWMESRARQYGDYQIVQDKDFAKLAEEGRAEYESATPAGRPLNAHAPQLGFSQMTDFEQDIYFALYKKKGLAAADQFYSDIEGSLLARTKENIRAGAEESAQSGFFGRAFNELVSIGMAGLEVPLNIAYLIGSVVEGEGSKWLRIPSYAAKTANETAIQEMHRIYEGTIWDKVWPSLAEMINSRGRSYVTGYLFGSLIPKSAGDVIHAFPIATIAFGEAYEEAVDNGLKPWQAWTLGAINFACESVTEGIKYGHYESLFDGNTITLATFKEYFTDKVAQLEWLSEATGETLNNILERAANRYFAGDKSEHNKRVNQYIDSGLCSSVKEAEAMVASDYVREDIHTAITSALSDFLDVGLFAYGKLKSTASYALQLQSYRKNVDANATIQTLRERDIQRIRNAEQLQKNMEAIRAEMIEKANQPFNPKNPAEVSEAARQSNQNEYDVDMTILENSADSDQGTVTETIAAVMRVSGQNTNRANAAAVAFVSRNGQNAINELSNMLDAGRKAGTNINTLKLGIQYALLGNGACNQTMNSEAYQNATPEQQAEMLSMATQEDANNQDVQEAVKAAVHESRVAEAEKDIFSEDGAKEIEAFQEAADEADMEAYVAQEEYSDRLDARKEAADNMTTVTMDFLADNSTENQRRKERAENELTAADAVAKEYEQHLRKAQEKQQKTSQALEQTKDEVMARVRQAAEERVSAEEATEAKIEADAAEQARIAAEEAAQAQAQAQAEEDIRTGKAQEDSDLALIEAQINKLNLKGEQAEQLRQKLTTFYHDMKTGNVDTSRLLSDAESALAINKMSRRLGVAIDVDKEGDPNALPEGKDGKYSNGKITLSHRLTVGQAMLQVAMHEITHSLEKTKSYGKYKDTVFSIMFSSPEQREKAIQDKIDFYTRSGVKDFTREDAEHEIVADFAMDDKTFANRDTINRMLDEGLGGKIRNALHNINQYLKNAKLDGEEKIKAENLRKAERQYIKAMNERRNINTHPSSEQFSVNQFAQAAGLFYNDVNVTDENGNVLYGPGLYTADPSDPNSNAVKVDKVTPEMMANTPVGLLTNAAQALGTMDRETAGKIHTMFADLMTMCTNLQDTNLVWEIAGSTLYSEFSAIKANSDKQYSTTVDFGTICTKTQAVINQLSRDMLRLGRGLTSQEILEVYNDVYNADLKVPCPVCYVFSRWLGVPSLLENIRQYQNRFLGEEGVEVDTAETQRRVNDFIAKAHQEYGIDKNFDDNLKKSRDKALAKIEKIKNGKDGIAETEAKIARLKDQLKTKQRKDWQNWLTSAEKTLAQLQDDLKQAQADYDNAEINAYSKAINKKKADIESSIKDKLIKIEGDDRGKRGINDDIRDAIKEGKPTDKLEAQREKVYAEIDALNEQLREVDAYNWVTQALCTMDREGNFVIDPEFKRTKNEILLDLNRTGEFAKDTKNWTYRSTRGAGMGKAILPYSGASIGDSVLGIGSRTMANPYEDGDSEGAFSALKSAIVKAKRQNLIGGQRFQSTSDFRPEWGLDYIMTFIEQQAIGSNGQLYTKVNEAVPLYASVGIDTNCSIMPYANGWHDPADGEIESMSDTERRSRVVTFKDGNGNERTVVLDFSDVTGMKYDAARLLSKAYDNVQMIMVGINDIHIRACLAGEEIDFVIPWHASGNTKSQLQNMMATVNETLTNSSDYTKVQTDQIANKEGLKEAHDKLERGETLTVQESDLIHKEQMRDARMRLLTGATLTATDIERIKESQFLTSLYERFEGKTLDGKELPHDSAYWIELPGNESESERVTMITGQAEQIFPYEYWDTSLTKDQADENGWRFVQYCQELGLTPRFSGANQTNEDNTVSRFGNFSGAVYDADGNIIGYDREQMAKGYWKTLIDRKMYDNNGNYRSQQQIDASKVQAGNLMQGEDGLVHTQSNIPDSISGANYRGAEAEAKYRQADQALKNRLTEKAKLDTKEGEQARIDLANLNAWETAHANDHEQYRVTPEINPYEDLTAGEMMQFLRDAGVDYKNAVERGDSDSALNAINNEYTAPEEQWLVNDNSDMTPAEMLQLLKDAGVYQQEEAPTDYEATGPQRQFGSETAQNAEGVSQTVKNWLKQHSDYNPDTNDAQINRAVKWVMSKRSDIDPDGFWGALDDVESKNFNPLTADGQARMYTLMSLASNKGRNGNIDVQLRLADAINKQGTTLGQALQARRLYRLMTPEGRLSVLQKEVDRVNNQLKSKGKEGNVKLSDWILRAASAAQTEEEFAKAREAMWQELGEQLPVSWWDRFQAWRMVSMLGNPRTHIRNMVGNLGFVPAVKTKNEIGAVLEHLFLPEGERTKAFKADKAALDFADADADRMQSKLTGEAKYSDKNQIEKNKKPFGKSFLGRIAQGVSDFSGDALEKEDWVFLRYHYKHSLAGWMTANNVTGEQLENDTEMLDKARAYAIEEAQKATYRDANAIAEWLSKGDKIPVWNVISTAVLPFKKTPMNIMKRGLEYSPLGFLKNITVDVARLAEYQKWANGKKAEKADWALSPAQYIDKISSGLTGLGIAGLGAFMKSMGWLTAGFKKDDPEDEFRKKKGQQEYSLNISLFGHDISYTIDWLAPSCMPMFVGATIQDIAERGGLGLGQTLQSLASVTESIWNLSFMDGLNSLFQTNQYESGDVATQILMKVGLNYASSFVPTAVGQIARTIDTARRKAYVQTGSKPSAAYYSFEQLQNKTPWSVWNIPYRDYRGNEDRKHWMLRAVENMLSPGYAREQVNDETLNEMERLYKNNQEDKDVKAVVPTDADKSFSVKGEKINLTDQQYDQMDVDRKRYAFELLDQLVADPYYAKVDDAARIDMINDVWTYATQQARYDQFPQVSREDWITRAQKNNLNMLDVIKKRSEDQIESDSVTGWSEALIDSIKKGNLDDVETAVGTLEVHDLDESDVEKIVKKAFQNDYVKAYKDDDDDRMQAIEAMLYDAGFVFDYESWLETTKKNEEKWLEQITGD